jgi:hypothetical protein
MRAAVVQPPAAPPPEVAVRPVQSGLRGVAVALHGGGAVAQLAPVVAGGQLEAPQLVQGDALGVEQHVPQHACGSGRLQ